MNIKLKEFRIENELSKENMAEKIGFSLSFYEKVETGARNPSYNFVSKFKKSFPTVDVGKIFFEDELHVKCGDEIA